MLKKGWDRISKFLFGDDIFISYARVDGGIYATGLANELVKQNFSCKFDLWGTETGKEMPDSLTNSLKRCSILVVIGTKGAAQNKNVGIEVEMFVKTGRPIIPIIFEGVELTEGRYCEAGKLQTPQKDSEAVTKPEKSLLKAIWADAITGQSISCEQNEALESGDPTAVIISRIEKSSTFTRKDQRLKRTSVAATALLLLLTALGIGAFAFATSQTVEATKANRKADEARKRADDKSKEAENQTKIAAEQKKKADDQTELANQATKLAETEKRNAETQQKLADQEKLKAEQASKLATEKTKLAADKTKLANQKTLEAKQATQLADEKTKLATDKALEAEKQTKIAEAQKKRGEKFLYATNMWQANNMYKDSDFFAFGSLISPTSQTLNFSNEFKGFEWNYLDRVTKGLVNFNTEDEYGPVGEKVRYSPSGKYLITVGLIGEVDHNVILWDSKKGKNLNSKQFYLLSSFDISPDENWLAVVSGNQLQIWNISDKENWTELSIDNDLFKNDLFSPEVTDITDIYFNENSELKILRSTDDWDDGNNFLTSWNLSGNNVKHEKIPEKYSNIRGFSKDGRLLVSYKITNTQSAEKNTQVSLYDAESIKEKEQKLISHGIETDPPLSYYLNISRRNPGEINRIVNMPIDLEKFYHSTVRPGIFVWDINDNTKPPKPVSGDRAVALSPNGKLLAVANENGLRIWDIDNEKTIREIPLLNFSDREYGLVCDFSPDSKELAVSGKDRDFQNFLTLWDVYSQENIFKFNNEMPLAVSQNGKHVVTWKNQPGELALWNTKTKQDKSIPFGGMGKPKIQFSPDGKYFNTVDIRIPLRLWNTMGEEINLGSEDSSCSSKVGYSSDGAKLAQLCREGYVRIFNLVKKKEIDKIPLKDFKFNESNEIAFISMDKKLVIYCNAPGSERIIKMVDIDLQGNEVRYADLGEYYSSSPNGKYLITRKFQREFDYEARLGAEVVSWNLQNLETSETLELNQPLSFTREGKIIFLFQPPGDLMNNNPDYQMLRRMPKLEPNLEIVKLDPLDQHQYMFHIQLSPKERWAMGIKRERINESAFDQFLYAYWDLNSGKVNYLRASQDCLHNPVFSQDETRLMTSCNSNGTIWLWDLEIEQPVSSIKAHECPEEKVKGCKIEKAIIFPDNKSMLTATEHEVKLWTTEF